MVCVCVSGVGASCMCDLYVLESYMLVVYVSSICESCVSGELQWLV